MWISVSVTRKLCIVSFDGLCRNCHCSLHFRSPSANDIIAPTFPVLVIVQASTGIISSSIQYQALYLEYIIKIKAQNTKLILTLAWFCLLSKCSVHTIEEEDE